MKKIQMVDLQTQYLQIKTDVDQAIQSVVDRASFINGEEVTLFKKELASYLGVGNVIPCANGTDALQVALMALDLKPGEEVITSDFTFAATVEVIALLGLQPVLVDVDPDTFTIDPDEIRKAISPKTRAIIPVHLFGQSAAMDEIMEIADSNNLYVIEDNAQSMGATYLHKNKKVSKTGTIGHVATTSFFPSKNLGCYGDGGAIFTQDDALAHRLQGIVNHGMYQKYKHDVVGVNSRLDTIQAAVLRCKLPSLDRYNSKRRAAARKYNTIFEGIENLVLPKLRGNDCLGSAICDSCDCHVFHQYTLKVKNKDRDALVKHLQAKSIPCGVYYPIPLHRQKAYQSSSYKESNFSVTNQLVNEVLSLPMHTELTDDQIQYITAAVIEFVS